MHVRFGHYTSVILLHGEDREELDAQIRKVERGENDSANG
jgi:hypothetical protein